ncbi:translational machinery component [Peniophora sp. CONT]|nr:translational machinery component [Peniophora sp. CONT]
MFAVRAARAAAPRASTSSLTQRSYSTTPVSRAIADAFAEQDLPPTADPSLYPKLADTNPMRAADAAIAASVTIKQHYVHITTTSNNTLITLCDDRKTPIKDGVWTGGMVGFKGSRKGEFEAGYQCAVSAFKRMEELYERDPGARFELLFSGGGKGRDAVVQALTLAEGEKVRGLVNRLTDKTPIKIGGTRAKKVRRTALRIHLSLFVSCVLLFYFG